MTLVEGWMTIDVIHDDDEVHGQVHCSSFRANCFAAFVADTQRHSSKGAMKFVRKSLISSALAHAGSKSSPQLSSLLNATRRAPSLPHPQPAASCGLSSRIQLSMSRTSSPRFLSVASARSVEGQDSGSPTCGCPTYDAIFKHVFTDDTARSSFLRTFIPGAAIASSTRLDTHINLAQEFRFLRTFIQRPAAAGGISDACHAPPNDAAAKFL